MTGRRRSNLDALVTKYGVDKCVGVQMDTTDFKSIPGKIEECMRAFGGGGQQVDSVYVGSGMQRTVDFSKPESIDMEAVEMEFNTNYVRVACLELLQGFRLTETVVQMAYMYIAKEVLPYLFKRDSPTTFMVGCI